MGRRRTKDEWLPPRTYKGKSAYEFRPISGGCIRLCSLDSPRALVYKEYANALEKTEDTSGLFSQLVDHYLKSNRYKSLSHRTQKDYLGYSKKVLKVFKKVNSGNIKPKHIRKYMDIRGEEAPVQANRELSFMGVVFSWGFERGKVDNNPCIGIKKFKESPRTRYITDEEYLLTLQYSVMTLKIAMEIAYLCAARVSDVLKLKNIDLKEEGIFIKQGKTGRKQIKEWSPRLRSVIALAKQLPGSSEYVIHNDMGNKISYTVNNDRWAEARKSACDELGIKADFTFHDLKAKGVSDFDGNKQLFSDHATPAQADKYDRKTRIAPALNVPNIHESDERN